MLRVNSTSSKHRIRLCHFALGSVIWLCASVPVHAQRGPLLPTRQDFPDPSNAGPPSGANKPVLPNDSLEPAGDSLGEPGAFDMPVEGVPEPPITSQNEPPVFEPPVLPLDESRTNQKLDFGIPVPKLPPLRAPARSGGTVTTYNVGIAVTEAFLNRLGADVRQEADSVCDRILNTPISGTQTTQATTRIDCRQNSKIAQIDVVLESLTSSNTLGRRPSATISTEGCHRADLIKPVFFDGQVLRTRRPQGFIRANNLNRRVVTSLTGVPLLGPIANRFAHSQAELSRTAGETETAALLSKRVVPQFNQSVDNKLSDANLALRNQVQSWLRDNRLWPEELKASTTDDEMRLRARFGDTVGAAVPRRRLFGRLGSVLLHESAINTYLAQLNLGGLRISDRQLQRTLSGLTQDEEVLVEVEGAVEIVEDMTTPMLYSIVFAPANPIHVRFDEDESEVVLRLTIEPVVSASIPMQEVHLPVLATVVNDSLELTFGTPGVVPADGTEPGTASRLIGEQIAKLTKTVSLPNRREFTFGAQRRLTAKVSDVAATNGWLLIAVD